MDIFVQKYIMASLLEDFYSDDLSTYTQTTGPNNMNRTLYQDENGEVFYYADDNLQNDTSNDAQYYYVDEAGNAFYYVNEEASPAQEYYYVDEAGNAFYYVNEEPGRMVEEVVYYDDDNAADNSQMFFKKEIHVANGPINTPKDNLGNSWDAASFERDKEIQRIATDENLSYGDAYREFGRRYEEYSPDLSNYM